LNKNILIKVVIYLVVMVSYSVVLMGDQVMSRLHGEDQAIESLGAFFFLTGSVLFFSSYFQSSRPGKDKDHLRSKKNIYYLLLAVIFFIGFGEEISWGQRIFGWETPQYLKKVNRQKETTFHNIKLFNSKLFFKGGNRKVERPFLSIILDVNSWFFLFWFSYCLLLPLMNHYSLRLNRYFSGKRIPLPPLWIGFLLLTNFIIFVVPYFVYYLLGSRVPPMYHSFTEIRESNEAFIFAILAFDQLRKQLFLKNGKLIREEKLKGA
jgi:hypothetical protein